MQSQVLIESELTFENSTAMLTLIVVTLVRSHVCRHVGGGKQLAAELARSMGSLGVYYLNVSSYIFLSRESVVAIVADAFIVSTASLPHLHHLIFFVL